MEIGKTRNCVETRRPPGGVFSHNFENKLRTSWTSMTKLKINCDHASRRCPEFICLEELKTHVATCGYASVLCSNTECGMEINKQDKVRHETEVCEYRRVKSHDCGQIVRYRKMSKH